MCILCYRTARAEPTDDTWIPVTATFTGTPLCIYHVPILSRAHEEFLIYRAKLLAYSRPPFVQSVYDYFVEDKQFVLVCRRPQITLLDFSILESQISAELLASAIYSLTMAVYCCHRMRVPVGYFTFRDCLVMSSGNVVLSAALLLQYHCTECYQPALDFFALSNIVVQNAVPPRIYDKIIDRFPPIDVLSSCTQLQSPKCHSFKFRQDEFLDFFATLRGEFTSEALYNFVATMIQHQHWQSVIQTSFLNLVTIVPEADTLGDVFLGRDCSNCMGFSKIRALMAAEKLLGSSAEGPPDPSPGPGPGPEEYASVQCFDPDILPTAANVIAAEFLGQGARSRGGAPSTQQQRRPAAQSVLSLLAVDPRRGQTLLAPPPLATCSNPAFYLNIRMSMGPRVLFGFGEIDSVVRTILKKYSESSKLLTENTILKVVTLIHDNTEVLSGGGKTVVLDNELQDQTAKPDVELTALVRGAALPAAPPESYLERMVSASRAAPATSGARGGGVDSDAAALRNRNLSRHLTATPYNRGAADGQASAAAGATERLASSRFHGLHANADAAVFGSSARGVPGRAAMDPTRRLLLFHEARVSFKVVMACYEPLEQFVLNNSRAVRVIGEFGHKEFVVLLRMFLLNLGCYFAVSRSSPFPFNGVPIVPAFSWRHLSTSLPAKTLCLLIKHLDLGRWMAFLQHLEAFVAAAEERTAEGSYWFACYFVLYTLTLHAFICKMLQALQVHRVPCDRDVDERLLYYPPELEASQVSVHALHTLPLSFLAYDYARIEASLVSHLPAFLVLATDNADFQAAALSCMATLGGALRFRESDGDVLRAVRTLSRHIPNTKVVHEGVLQLFGTMALTLVDFAAVHSLYTMQSRNLNILSFKQPAILNHRSILDFRYTNSRQETRVQAGLFFTAAAAAFLLVDRGDPRVSSLCVRALRNLLCPEAYAHVSHMDAQFYQQTMLNTDMKERYSITMVYGRAIEYALSCAATKPPGRAPMAEAGTPSITPMKGAPSYSRRIYSLAVSALEPSFCFAVAGVLWNCGCTLMTKAEYGALTCAESVAVGGGGSGGRDDDLRCSTTVSATQQALEGRTRPARDPLRPDPSHLPYFECVLCKDIVDTGTVIFEYDDSVEALQRALQHAANMFATYTACERPTCGCQPGADLCSACAEANAFLAADKAEAVGFFSDHFGLSILVRFLFEVLVLSPSILVSLLALSSDGSVLLVLATVFSFHQDRVCKVLETLNLSADAPLGVNVVFVQHDGAGARTLTFRETLHSRPGLPRSENASLRALAPSPSNAPSYAGTPTKHARAYASPRGYLIGRRLEDGAPRRRPGAPVYSKFAIVGFNYIDSFNDLPIPFEADGTLSTSQLTPGAATPHMQSTRALPPQQTLASCDSFVYKLCRIVVSFHDKVADINVPLLTLLTSLITPGSYAFLAGGHETLRPDTLLCTLFSMLFDVSVLAAEIVDRAERCGEESSRSSSVSSGKGPYRAPSEDDASRSHSRLQTLKALAAGATGTAGTAGEARAPGVADSSSISTHAPAHSAALRRRSSGYSTGSGASAGQAADYQSTVHSSVPYVKCVQICSCLVMLLNKVLRIYTATLQERVGDLEANGAEILAENRNVFTENTARSLFCVLFGQRALVSDACKHLPASLLTLVGFYSQLSPSAPHLGLLPLLPPSRHDVGTLDFLAIFMENMLLLTAVEAGALACIRRLRHGLLDAESRTQLDDSDQTRPPSSGHSLNARATPQGSFSQMAGGSAPQTDKSLREQTPGSEVEQRPQPASSAETPVVLGRHFRSDARPKQNAKQRLKRSTSKLERGAGKKALPALIEDGAEQTPTGAAIPQSLSAMDTSRLDPSGNPKSTARGPSAAMYHSFGSRRALAVKALSEKPLSDNDAPDNQPSSKESVTSFLAAQTLESKDSLPASSPAAVTDTGAGRSLPNLAVSSTPGKPSIPKLVGTQRLLVSSTQDSPVESEENSADSSIVTSLDDGESPAERDHYNADTLHRIERLISTSISTVTLSSAVATFLQVCRPRSQFSMYCDGVDCLMSILTIICMQKADVGQGLGLHLISPSVIVFLNRERGLAFTTRFFALAVIAVREGCKAIVRRSDMLHQASSSSLSTPLASAEAARQGAGFGRISDGHAERGDAGLEEHVPSFADLRDPLIYGAIELGREALTMALSFVCELSLHESYYHNIPSANFVQFIDRLCSNSLFAFTKFNRADFSVDTLPQPPTLPAPDGIWRNQGAKSPAYAGVFRLDPLYCRFLTDGELADASIAIISSLLHRRLSIDTFTPIRIFRQLLLPSTSLDTRKRAMHPLKLIGRNFGAEILIELGLLLCECLCVPDQELQILAVETIQACTAGAYIRIRHLESLRDRQVSDPSNPQPQDSPAKQQQQQRPQGQPQDPARTEEKAQGGTGMSMRLSSMYSTATTAGKSLAYLHGIQKYLEIHDTFVPMSFDLAHAPPAVSQSSLTHAADGQLLAEPAASEPTEPSTLRSSLALKQGGALVSGHLRESEATMKPTLQRASMTASILRSKSSTFLMASHKTFSPADMQRIGYTFYRDIDEIRSNLAVSMDSFVFNLLDALRIDSVECTAGCFNILSLLYYIGVAPSFFTRYNACTSVAETLRSKPFQLKQVILNYMFTVLQAQEVRSSFQRINSVKLLRQVLSMHTDPTFKSGLGIVIDILKQKEDGAEKTRAARPPPLSRPKEQIETIVE